MSTEESIHGCQLEIQGNSHVQVSRSPITPVPPAKRHNLNSGIIYTCYFFVQQNLSKFYFDKIFINILSSCMHPKISSNFQKKNLTSYTQLL